jgi:glutamyl-tRNA reductase
VDNKAARLTRLDENLKELKQVYHVKVSQKYTFKYEDKSHKISNSIKKNVRKKKLNFFIVIKLCSKYIIKMLVEPYKKLKEIFDDDRKALLYLINNDYVNGYKNCSSNCGKDMTLNLNKKL